MWVYKFGRFEVATKRELVRTVVGMSIVAPLALAARGPRAQRLIAGLTRRLLGLNETVTGSDNVDPETAYIVVPLHEGFADPLLLEHLPLDLRFVARDELFDWRVLGPILANSHQIRVTPENQVAGYRRLFEETKRALAQGESVVWFPQGTLVGIESAFNRGPFRVADRLGVPVLPVVITGTHLVWEHPFSDRLRFGQHVEMNVLAPLPVGEAETRMADTQRQMKSLALDSEAPARRYDPDRDGYWDDYSFEIDPSYPDLATRVADHRASRTLTDA